MVPFKRLKMVCCGRPQDRLPDRERGRGVERAPGGHWSGCCATERYQLRRTHRLEPEPLVAAVRNRIGHGANEKDAAAWIAVVDPGRRERVDDILRVRAADHDAGRGKQSV